MQNLCPAPIRHLCPQILPRLHLKQKGRGLVWRETWKQGQGPAQSQQRRRHAASQGEGCSRVHVSGLGQLPPTWLEWQWAQPSPFPLQAGLWEWEWPEMGAAQAAPSPAGWAVGVGVAAAAAISQCCPTSTGRPLRQVTGTRRVWLYN